MLVIIKSLPNYKLKKPIKASIEVLADIQSLSLFPYGESQDVILKELGENIQALFEELSSREGHLSHKLKKQLKILREHIDIGRVQ